MRVTVTGATGLIGTRIVGALRGGMPLYKYVGNRVLTTLPVLAYQEAFKFGDIGYGIPPLTDVDIADRADREAGRRIRCPVLVTWASGGLVPHFGDPLSIWATWAEDVRGEAMRAAAAP